MAAAVKICGVTTPGAIRTAMDAGAAFVGLVFHPSSPRAITPEAAGRLLARVGLEARGRRSLRVVAVTVDAPDDLLEAIRDRTAPDFIQLHGRESLSRARHVRALTGAGIIRAAAVSSPEDLEGAAAWEEEADHLLFDARPPQAAGRAGGAGVRFDWSLMAGRRFRRPWFLAGGLSPDNAAEALEVSGAPMLDVSSGVERAPGVKDDRLIRDFLDRTRRASPGG